MIKMIQRIINKNVFGMHNCDNKFQIVLPTEVFYNLKAKIVTQHF